MESVKSPFRQPTETQEDFEELIRRDKEDFERQTQYHYRDGKYVLIHNSLRDVMALNRYRSLIEGEDICVDCGAHEEQACEFDCLTRRLATEEDVDEAKRG